MIKIEEIKQEVIEKINILIEKHTSLLKEYGKPVDASLLITLRTICDSVFNETIDSLEQHMLIELSELSVNNNKISTSNLMDKKELIGRQVIWTRTEPGKSTKRVISRIAFVHNFSISLDNYPGIYFFLDGKQRNVSDNVISKIQLIDEEYAKQLTKKWQEDTEKTELINFIIENKKYLISMPLKMLEEFANELETHLKRTVLS